MMSRTYLYRLKGTRSLRPVRMYDDGAKTYIEWPADVALPAVFFLDDRCRQIIAKESLEGYNSDWRFGERLLPTGRTERFEKPVLTSDEFRSKLVFQRLEVTGPSVLTLRYGDDDMFGGHWLSVTSFDGVALEDTNVALEG